MRIIAGSAGGIPLSVPRTGGVRPTMDQVRGAIFSSLAERVEGARVLDLFAGAGGLGIEALSRGAKTVIFVEHYRPAVDCIRKNLEKARLSGGQVVCLDALAYLDRLSKEGAPEPFDLIFADPPYTTTEQPVDFCAKLLASPGLGVALAADGLFVLEKSPRHALAPPDPGAWEIVRQKRYGSTEVLFLTGRKPGMP
jgi:16S rRNA (guanine966-N2)-methyltransferase